jgi:phage shock protein A
MQDNLVQLRQSVAQAIATQKRTERQRGTTLITIIKIMLSVYYA